jgi:histone H1/5
MNEMGSFLRAIKKYIATNYEVDTEQLSPFINKYLKMAVAAGELVDYRQGSFRLFQIGSCKEEESYCAYNTSSWSSEPFICLKV